MVTITIKEYIELLEIKISYLKIAKDLDSSWYYSIDKIKEQIKKLKQQL